MKNLLLAVLLLGFNQLTAQTFSYKNKNQGGTVSIGMRSTMSAFNGSDHSHAESVVVKDPHSDPFALGLGGQFRVQANNRVNTEWFFDYLPSSGSQVRRNDYHIGWSVMFYVLENPNPLFRPYVLAGHCFDYTYRQELNNRTNQVNRWSSAVQAGIGTHIRLNDRLDISLMSQYMLHLGTHIETVYTDYGVSFEKSSGGSLEGHLLTTVSLNYKIADLW
jgi:hypothetical protein